MLSRDGREDDRRGRFGKRRGAGGQRVAMTFVAKPDPAAGPTGVPWPSHVLTTFA
jgi:hypothetical protein